MGDLISRQAAIDAFERFIHELGINDEPYNYGEMALSEQNVPSVEPERPRGKWIRGEAYPHRIYCSECYKTFIPNDEMRAWVDGNLPRKYCPECGAKMEVDTV